MPGRFTNTSSNSSSKPSAGRFQTTSTPAVKPAGRIVKAEPAPVKKIVHEPIQYPAVPEKSSFLKELPNVTKEFGKGVVKEAGQLGAFLGNAAESLFKSRVKDKLIIPKLQSKLGMDTNKKSLTDTAIAAIEKKKGIAENTLFKPSNKEQKAGKVYAQVAEYLIPGSAGMKVASSVNKIKNLGRFGKTVLPLLAEGATDAVASAPLLFSQKERGEKVTGKELGLNTAISLAAPGVFKAAGKPLKALGRFVKGESEVLAKKGTEDAISSVLAKQAPVEEAAKPVFKETAIPNRSNILTNDPNVVKSAFKAESTPVLEAPALKKSSRFAENVAMNPSTAPEVAEGLTKNPPTYDTVSNIADKQKAAQRVATDINEAKAFVLSEEKPSSEHTATAIEVIKRLQDSGDHSGAILIADNISGKLSKAGQAIQAAKIMENLSPESVLIKAKTFVNKENTKATIFNKAKTLTEDDAQAMYEVAKKMQAAESSEVKSELANEIADILASYKHNSVGKKISSIQTAAQLLNPKTIVRNVIGNEMFYRVERLSKMLAMPFDIARSSLTGSQRTITMKTGAGSYWSDWLKGLKAGFKGSNLGPDTQFQIPTRTFNNKWNPMYWMERSVGASLKSFDYAAYKRGVNETLYEIAYLRAKNEGLKGAALKDMTQKYVENADGAILDIADRYGKYITFQDDNLISKGAIAIKKGLNVGQDFGLGDLVLKYPKTPGALMARALEYSPAGFLKSAYEIAMPVLKGTKKTMGQNKELAMTTARAIVGTAGFTGMGYFLADKGIITGKQSSDKDVSALQKSVGLGKYQINTSALIRFIKSGFKNATVKPGDKLYTYDWAQPIAVSLSIGANMNGGRKATDIGMGIGEQLAAGASTITEQPLLSGITKLFGARDLIGGAQSVLEGSLSSFTPTVLNQLRQYTDNQSRNTSDESSLQTALNLSKNKIPGLSKELPPRYDTLGQPVKNMENNNLFAVFFSPGAQTTFKENPETKLILDLIAETGSTSQLPRVQPTTQTIFGEKIVVDPKDYASLQKYAGERTMRGLETLMTQEAFNELTNDEKVQAITHNLGDVAAGVKALLSAKQIMEVRNTQGQEAADAMTKDLKPGEIKILQDAVNYLKANPTFFDLNMNPLPEKPAEEKKTMNLKGLENMGILGAGVLAAVATRGKSKGLLKEGLEKLAVKEGTLLATHSTTKEALENIVKEGKIWGPSVAVFNKEKSKLALGFGDYHIVINKKSVNPANKDVIMYTDDVFSPRFISDEKSLNKLKADLAKGKDIVGGEISKGEIPVHTLFAERVNSLDDLRTKANKLGTRDEARDSYMNRIVTVKDNFENLIPSQLADDLGDERVEDLAFDFIRTLAKNDSLRDPKKVQKLMMSEYNTEISEKGAQKFIDNVVGEMNNIKVEYFEAKMLKGVDLKEIDTVLIPSELGMISKEQEALVKSLEEKGIRVEKYNRLENRNSSSDQSLNLQNVFKKVQESAFGIGIVGTGVGMSSNKLKKSEAPINQDPYKINPYIKANKLNGVDVSVSQSKDPVVKRLSKPTVGEGTYYDPTDANQTKDKPDGIGAYGRQIESGSIAFGNRYFHEDLKKGKLIYVKIDELKDVKTPYGNGIFRIDDTMNQRYNNKGQFNIDFNHTDKIPEELRKQGRFPLSFSIVKIE